MKFIVPWKKTESKKVCPKCGGHFSCIVKESCWCDALKISKENLMIIRRSYMDCLCSSCLAEYAEPNSETKDLIH